MPRQPRGLTSYPLLSPLLSFFFASGRHSRSRSALVVLVMLFSLLLIIWALMGNTAALIYWNMGSIAAPDDDATSTKQQRLPSTKDTHQKHFNDGDDEQLLTRRLEEAKLIKVHPYKQEKNTDEKPSQVMEENNVDVHVGRQLVAASGERQRWVLDLLLPWLGGGGAEEGDTYTHDNYNNAFSPLQSLSDEDFCSEQVSRVWSLAERRLSGPLLNALKEHRVMHRAVAAGKPLPGQKYLIWSLSGGVGNRFLAMASTYLTAVLSGRVFLMRDWFAPLPKAGTKQTPVFLYAPKELGGYRLEELDILFDLEPTTPGRNSSSHTKKQHHRRLHSKRPLNKELLCPLVPMMSLTEFRLMYPRYFVNTEEEEGTATAATAVGEDVSFPRGSFGHGGRSHTEHIKVDIRHRHDKKLQHWNRFLCSALSVNGSSRSGGVQPAAVQQEGEEVGGGDVEFFPQRFVYIWTNQYYLPGLFSNPKVSGVMRDFFPPPPPSPSFSSPRLGIKTKEQKFVGPYESIIRLLVIPSKAVTQQVVRFFHQSKEHESRLLVTERRRKKMDAVGGIERGGTQDDEEGRDEVVVVGVKPFVAAHIRAFQIPSIDPLAQAFDNCLRKAGDQPISRSTTTNTTAGESRSFFLATMHKSVREYFIRRYSGGGKAKKNTKEGGLEVLSLAPPSGDQLTGQRSGDQLALADMILLSMSSKLYVSGGSTFGMFSAAFGGLAPTLITNSKGGGSRSCISPSTEDQRMALVYDTGPQPCFGSWYHYDHLSSRGRQSDGGGDLGCKLLTPLPEYTMRCKG